MSPPDYALSTDEELLNFWFEGEGQAFNHFFNRHSVRVRPQFNVIHSIPFLP